MTHLWIDCTRTISSGLHTGIQRLVRRLLQHAHAQHLSVAPVYWCPHRHAWQPLSTLKPHPQDIFSSPLHWSSPPLKWGDALLLPDALWHIDAIAPLQAAQRLGLAVHGVCHDVLPAHHPQWFPAALAQPFTDYWQALLNIAESIICVSTQTQRSLRAWAQTQHWSLPPLRVVYPGIDAFPARTISADLPSLPREQAIIMQVGTVEPRKGHMCLADAFEQLWQQGHDYYWLVVGQAGWASARLKQRLQRLHEEAAPMSWMQHASDAQLHALYRRATVCVGAAADEGYGLPVSEAACAGLSLVLNDTAIYREVHARTPWAKAHWVSGHQGWPQGLSDAVATVAADRAGRVILPPIFSADLCWSQATQAFIMAALSPRATP